MDSSPKNIFGMCEERRKKKNVLRVGENVPGTSKEHRNKDPGPVLGNGREAVPRYSLGDR